MQENSLRPRGTELEGAVLCGSLLETGLCPGQEQGCEPATVPSVVPASCMKPQTA